MRPLSLLPAALLLLSTGTLAQVTPPAAPSAAPISTVQVTAPVKGRWIAPDQADHMAGNYAMSNGWHMHVKPGARFISASINRERPLRLVQVEPYKFVTGDGMVTMQFNQGDDGEDMTMTYVPDPRLAQAVVISSRLAQR